MFCRVLLAHALAFSASQFVRKKKSPRIVHSGVFELTNLTYTRLEDNLIRRRHRGDRLLLYKASARTILLIVLLYEVALDVDG